MHLAGFYCPALACFFLVIVAQHWLASLLACLFFASCMQPAMKSVQPLPHHPTSTTPCPTLHCPTVARQLCRRTECPGAESHLARDKTTRPVNGGIQFQATKTKLGNLKHKCRPNAKSRRERQRHRSGQNARAYKYTSRLAFSWLDAPMKITCAQHSYALLSNMCIIRTRLRCFHLVFFFRPVSPHIQMDVNFWVNRNLKQTHTRNTNPLGLVNMSHFIRIINAHRSALPCFVLTVFVGPAIYTGK